MGVSNFGVLAQIQSNIILMYSKKKVFICLDCFGISGVVPLKQPIFDIFGVVAGV